MTTDEIDASKAPLIDHLIELRQRLLCAIGVGIAFIVCFFFAKQIYNILVLPYLVGARRRRADRDDLHGAAGVLLHPAEARAVRRGVPRFPIIATQIYKFVAPGLYKNERARLPALSRRDAAAVHRSARCVVYFVVMPLAMRFFLSMEQTGGPVEIHLQARVSEYLSLIMTLILGFGICSSCRWC